MENFNDVQPEIKSTEKMSDYQETMRPNQTLEENKESVESLENQFDKLTVSETADINVDDYLKNNTPGEMSEIEKEPNINEYALSSFKEENWEKLGDDVKEMRCEELCNTICDDLGMDADNRPEVVFLSKDDWDEMIGEGNAGGYSEDENKIYLKEEDIKGDNKNPEDLANTIAHETRHAYQHDQVDKYVDGEAIDIDDKTAHEWTDSFATNRATVDVADEKHDSLATEKDAYRYAAHYTDWLYNH